MMSGVNSKAKTLASAKTKMMREKAKTMVNVVNRTVNVDVEKPSFPKDAYDSNK